MGVEPTRLVLRRQSTEHTVFRQAQIGSQRGDLRLAITAEHLNAQTATFQSRKFLARVHPSPLRKQEMDQHTAVMSEHHTGLFLTGGILPSRTPQRPRTQFDTGTDNFTHLARQWFDSPKHEQVFVQRPAERMRAGLHQREQRRASSVIQQGQSIGIEQHRRLGRERAGLVKNQHPHAIEPRPKITRADENSMPAQRRTRQFLDQRKCQTERTRTRHHKNRGDDRTSSRHVS